MKKKSKATTLHLRVDDDMYDVLYRLFREAQHELDYEITFSEFVRRVLKEFIEKSVEAYYSRQTPNRD